MTRTESTAPTKLFQFGLRSIFVATAALAFALGVLKWLAPAPFLRVMILTVQFSAIIAILVKSRGTAWPGVVILGSMAALLFCGLAGIHHGQVFNLLFWVSISSWYGGGIVASGTAKKRSRFVRWAWLFALAWLLIVIVPFAIYLFLTEFANALGHS